MQYVSTRGLAPALGFRDVLMTGLATDGGLYVPDRWPTVSADRIAAFAEMPYAEVAFEVIRPFLNREIADGAFREMCRLAYAGFRNAEIAPLRKLASDFYVLELFHGPTLAFKDVAMQLLARMMDAVLTERGKRVTIVGATSGDTGSAAIEAFRNHERVDVFILFPEGRVSAIQQRQMTTTGARNIYPIAIKGTFDDCQAILKGLFANRQFRDSVSLSGVNSINWARILGQIVYYFTAAAALGAPQRPVAFTVPTGNFGDIYAGYVARRMGLPIEPLVIATNVNDILARTLATGRYDIRSVTATSSPSMDIQVSSNFERLLFEAYNRDAAAVRRLMENLARDRMFEIAPEPLAAIRRDFGAGTTDEAETARTINTVFDETGFVADPHTAVGFSVARGFARAGRPMVTLSTAHPAKFPDAVLAASGQRPKLPDGFPDIDRKPERYETLPNDVTAVERYISAHARAVGASAIS